MGLTIKGCSGDEYSFEGPYDNASKLEDHSGVYFIVCLKNGKYYPIDVGESKNVKTRIENHNRADCWNKNCNGTLMVAVRYTPNKQQHGRMEIEQDIRCNYDFPCGDR